MEASPARPPLRVLVAEDDPSIALLMRDCLARAGHQIDVAADGGDAVARFSSGQYDLVLMDMRMPVLDGPAAVAQIRQREKERGAARPLPIIGLTAGTAADEAQRCLAAGCTAFLRKPFSKKQLLAAVSSAGEARPPLAADAGSPGGPASLDPGLADLLPAFISLQRRDIESMTAALSRADHAKLADCGHRLIGAGASYGFAAISRIGRDLEQAAKDQDAPGIAALLRRWAECLDRVPVPAGGPGPAVPDGQTGSAAGKDDGRAQVILVVEDDPSLLLLIDSWLAHSGFKVLVAGDGQAGLAQAKILKPDLILSDVMMPGLDGYGMCAKLQADRELAVVPVIFLTALDQEKDRAAALAAGAVEHIAKPVGRETLLAAVRKHLATGSRWQRLRRETVSFPARRGDDFKRFLAFVCRQSGAPAEARDRVAQGASRDIYALAAELGLSAAQMARLASEFLSLEHLPHINPNSVQLGALPLPFCREHQVIVIEKEPGRNAFVVSNPLQAELFDILKRYPELGDPRRPLVTDPANILRLLKQPDREAVTELLRTDSNKVSVSDMAHNILESAVADRASDIHIEPKESSTLVRFRVDGDLREVYALSRDSGQMLVSRLKALGRMDVAERRKPQDGTLQTTIAGRSFIVRLATTSTPQGESVVMRLLEPWAKPKSLEELGMAATQVAHMLEFARRQHGLLLVAGTTGSGKTTTIYSLLQHIDCLTRSLISVEDPVEYRIPAANQQQVDEKAGLDFEALLKSSVRQDPDILFLGEVRDAFSAKMAIDFSSTGHLTLSSVHTTSATKAIFRLERLGISRGSMADSILAVIAQKLIKLVCPHCKELSPPSPEEIEMLAAFTKDIPERVAHPKGCPRCAQTGYLGREGVYEIVAFYPEISEMVRQGAPVTKIRDFARQRGDYLISDHAMTKVRAGLFAVKDVVRQVLMEDAEQPHEGPESETPAAQAQPESEILVVEDDPATLAWVQRVLANGGHRVTPAGDGADALMQLAVRRFDLILSDINMPNLDGLKLLEIKSLKGIDTPVIFLTAQASPELQSQALRLGAAGYLRKPVAKETLLLSVRRALAEKS
ncbi:MAG: ATPase, T2SS/T4P/T4SS family [Elusimicrobia bacterium]|nr:ATPase, T2SS/T4P/T4SS family [Elusimicrobiota bacterium]